MFLSPSLPRDMSCTPGFVIVSTKTFAGAAKLADRSDNAGRVFPCVRSVAIPAIVVVVVIDGVAQ